MNTAHCLPSRTLQVFIEPDFDQLSSKFAEFTFQALRCADRTSCTFSMLSAESQLRNHIAMLTSEVESGLEFPNAKRGAFRGKGAVYEVKVGTCPRYLSTL